MITEQQEEQATSYALGVLGAEERLLFVAQLRVNPELRDFVVSLQRTAEKVALLSPKVAPEPSLKNTILRQIQSQQPPSGKTLTSVPALMEGLKFIQHAETAGWKQLPVEGAWLKLLSFEPARGYAVLLGKLDAGARYPAHQNAGPEDFYVLTGDLHVGDRVLGPGDFHHADAGTFHTENYSIEGCTLLAVLTVDDPLVAFAMASD
jgi:anti-sigma factor ChrR (cupin superfamily)